MAKKLSQTVKGYEGTLDADDARHVVRPAQRLRAW
jgi:hypothetical protein